MKFQLFLATIVSLNLIIFATPTYAVPLNLEKNPNSFSDWCNQKPKLSEETRHTVEVLLEKAETQNCVEANQKLGRLTELSLDKNQIRHIKPRVRFRIFTIWYLFVIFIWTFTVLFIPSVLLFEVAVLGMVGEGGRQ